MSDEMTLEDWLVSTTELRALLLREPPGNREHIAQRAERPMGVILAPVDIERQKLLISGEDEVNRWAPGNELESEAEELSGNRISGAVACGSDEEQLCFAIEGYQHRAKRDLGRSAELLLGLLFDLDAALARQITTADAF